MLCGWQSWNWKLRCEVDAKPEITSLAVELLRTIIWLLAFDRHKMPLVEGILLVSVEDVILAITWKALFIHLRRPG